jgi:hypothetical protein
MTIPLIPTGRIAENGSYEYARACKKEGQAAIDAMRPEIDAAFQRGVVAGLEAAAQGWIPYNGEIWTNAAFIRQIDPATIKDTGRDTPSSL